MAIVREPLLLVEPRPVFELPRAMCASEGVVQRGDCCAVVSE